MSPSDPCACDLGQPYRACCRRFHRREAAPADAPTLVRARFCAFARKEADFLWETLHPAHPDRQREAQQVLQELRLTSQRFRFVRLHILAHQADQAAVRARVLFWPELFEKGKDRSFVELSDFEKVEGLWTYRSGELLGRASLLQDPRTLTIEQFLARAEAHRGEAASEGP